MGCRSGGGRIGRELRAGAGNRGSAREQQKGDHGGGRGHCRQNRGTGPDKVGLFRQRTYGGLHHEAGRGGARDLYYKLQRRLPIPLPEALYGQERNLHGYACGVRGHCLPAVEISGYEQCGGKAEAAGELRSLGTDAGVGDAAGGETAFGGDMIRKPEQFACVSDIAALLAGCPPQYVLTCDRAAWCTAQE